jgi:hypothetical protein
MNRYSRVHQADRGIRVIAETTATADGVPADGDQLAREVVQAYADELRRYRHLKDREPERLDPAERPDDWDVKIVREQPPEKVSFFDVEKLSRIDPAQGEALWLQVKEAARRDLDSGWLAGRALEYLGGSAWERACFLAIRDRLRRAWKPRNDCESMLVDEIAQYEMLRLQWLAVFSMRSRDPETLLQRKRLSDSSESERRLTAHEQTAEAARMVEHIQRLHQNAIRTLLSMRRGKKPTVFQRADQLNVALGPQLNVNSTPNDSNGEPE